MFETLYPDRMRIFLLTILVMLWVASVPVRSQSPNAPLPADNATGVSTVPTLSATLPGGATTATIFIRPVPTPGDDFSFVVVPDSQNYVDRVAEFDPSFFKDQIDWIVAERAAQNIRYVSHVGDIVQNYDSGNLPEWQHAANALYRLENPATTGRPGGIPYGVLPGNHDLSRDGNLTSNFYNQFFGPAHFAGRPYYGGSLDPTNNDIYYTLFEAEGIGFLHFNIQWQPDMAVAGPWMRSIARQYPNRLVFATAHHALETGNPAPFSGTGQEIFEALRVLPNFFMILGGHRPGEGRRADIFQGRTIHSILSNFQSLPNGGNAWLRIHRFSPTAETMSVKTYSPVLDGFMTMDSSEFELDLDLYPWIAPWEIVTSTSVPFGGQISGAVANLLPGAAYEWFVLAGDTRGPIWRFETASNSPPSIPQIPSRSVTEGTLVSIPLQATDPNPGQQLSWTILQAPSEMTVDAEGVLRWQTTEADGPGSYTVEIVVADNGTPPQSTNASFSVNVLEVNEAPILTSDPAGAFVLAEAGQPFNLQLLGLDADVPANSLSYSITSGFGLGMNLDDTTGAFTWTPFLGDAHRKFPIRFRVSDNATPVPARNTLDVDVIVVENGRLDMKPVIKKTEDASLLEWVSFPGYRYAIERSNSLLNPNWVEEAQIQSEGVIGGWPFEISSQDHAVFRLRLIGP